MSELTLVVGTAISIFCSLATGIIVFTVGRMIFKNVQEDIDIYMTKRKNNEL